jgi:hypothetical protein
MSLDMHPDIRAQWCAALRSGEYQQGRGQLRRHDGYCCLGVLTDLAIKAGAPTVLLSWDDEDEDGLSVEGELPDDVRVWAGLADNDPVLDPGEPGALWHTAAWHNDNGESFAEIADLIDGGAS